MSKMDRKSQHSSKNKNHGKEFNKQEQQKRKELAVLIDKLLCLTSDIPPVGKTYDHHVEIESVLKQIQNLEQKIQSLQENQKGKIERKPRQANIERFLKWLSDNDVQYEGLEIDNFEGYDLGLKATKDFQEGSQILTIPKKIMMSEQDARQSQLMSFFYIENLIETMPNVTLALFLLLEKSKPDSFWAPYIDILPDKYSTVLYFTSEELAELKPSPVAEASLKLYKSIARQYAYFYKKFYLSTLPGLKELRNIYTFENYRWAVSTVMTRQNNVDLSERATLAFIPLWDMCNHESGKISTDFNKEHSRAECYALRDFKSGEQIFIFYGARSNADFFLHNGFVYPKNQYDSLSLSLGVSTGDVHREKRMQILYKLGLDKVTQYNLYRSEMPLSPELLAFIRVFNMNEEELSKWSSEGLPSDLVSSDATNAEVVGRDIDGKAYNYLRTRCNLLRTLYMRNISTDDDSTNLHRKNIKLLKECEMQILDRTIKYLDDAIEKLNTNGKVMAAQMTVVNRAAPQFS